MSDKALKYTEITDELGAELRRLRLERKLTLVQVASALNSENHQLSNVHLSRIETGQRRIDDDLLELLCGFYEVDARTIAIRASNAHINRILLSMGEPPAEDSAAQKIESAAQEMNETGQELLARLGEYLSKVTDLKK